jgi:aryl-alcohol dehydrogenase-like predicted oxidoreductase
MARREFQCAAAERFVLGTAQLGMDYGIANRSGRPDETAAQAMVAAAWSRGCGGFDTAAAYGESEAVLGRAFAALGIREQVAVVGKGRGDAGPTALREGILASLSRLGVPSLRAWLLHDQGDLSAWDGAMAAAATALQRDGSVAVFGVSVYDPEPALRATEEGGFSAVQFPASPFDRRFLREPVAGRLAKTGARLYVRSIYLQGLALLDPADVPAGICRGREAAATLRRFCAAHGLEPDRFCLHYVLQRTAASGARLVIGAENAAQLERNLGLVAGPAPDPALADAWDERWPDDVEDLVLPMRWPPRKPRLAA